MHSSSKTYFTWEGVQKVVKPKLSFKPWTKDSNSKQMQHQIGKHGSQKPTACQRQLTKRHYTMELFDLSFNKLWISPPPLYWQYIGPHLTHPPPRVEEDNVSTRSCSPFAIHCADKVTQICSALDSDMVEQPQAGTKDNIKPMVCRYFVKFLKSDENLETISKEGCLLFLRHTLTLRWPVSQGYFFKREVNKDRHRFVKLRHKGQCITDEGLSLLYGAIF